MITHHLVVPLSSGPAPTGGSVAEIEGISNRKFPPEVWGKGGGGDLNRGRILGRNWDKSLKSFPPCYSQSPLLTDFTPHPPLSKSGLKLVCNINIVYRNLMSENS